MIRRHVPGAVTGVVIAVAIAFAAFPPDGLDPRAARALSLCIGTVALFAAGYIQEHVTAIGFFVVAVLAEVAPPQIVFSAFESSALWLVFGGLFIAMGVQRTGLGDRLARRLLGAIGGTYFRVIVSLVLASVILTIVMPSVMGRVLILVPLATALAVRTGFPLGSRPANGMVLAVALTSFMTAGGVLPSNVGNMIVAGSAENLFNIKLTFARYMLIQFPVGGAVKAVLIALVCWIFFRADMVDKDASTVPPGPWTWAERRMALILGAALVMWMTDSLHGIDPGWIGLAAGFICLLPGIGVLGPAAVNDDLKIGPFFYCAGMMGIGKILAWSGAGVVLGRGLQEIIEFQAGQDALNFGLLYLVSTSLGLVTNQMGVPAVLSPLAADLAAASGLPLFTVLMTIIVGYSSVILPYQTAPIVVALRMGGTSFATAARITLTMSGLTLLILVPMTYLWWRVLGLFG